MRRCLKFYGAAPAAVDEAGDEAVEDPVQIGTLEESGANSTLPIAAPEAGVPLNATIIVAALDATGGMSTGLTGIADDRSNVYTQVLEHVDGSGRKLELWIAPVTTALVDENDAITPTFEANFGERRLSICYVPNLALEDQPEDTREATATSDTPTVTGFLTTVQHCLMFGAVGYANVDGHTPATNWTELAEVGTASVKLATLFRIVSSVGLYPNTQCTLVTSGEWVMGTALFQSK